MAGLYELLAGATVSRLPGEMVGEDDAGDAVTSVIREERASEAPADSCFAAPAVWTDLPEVAFEDERATIRCTA